MRKGTFLAVSEREGKDNSCLWKINDLREMSPALAEVESLSRQERRASIRDFIPGYAMTAVAYAKFNYM